MPMHPSRQAAGGGDSRSAPWRTLAAHGPPEDRCAGGRGEEGTGPPDFAEQSHRLTEFISSPDEFSAIVAGLAGVAGILSLTAAKSGALIGVLISVTTLPAAANIGISVALGDTADALGSLGQLAINLTVIVLAGVTVLFIQRRLYLRRKAEHRQEKGPKAAGLPTE